MRIRNALPVLAIVLGGVGAYTYWRSTSFPALSSGEISERISKIRNDFSARHQPSITLDLEESRRSRAGPELNDPRTALPETHLYPYSEMTALSRYATSCAETDLPKIHSLNLKKALLWHRFVCGASSVLPPTFFKEKPWMHPLGESYAALALHSGERTFQSAEWRSMNAPYFHLREILQLSSEGTLLSPGELQRVLDGDALVLTPKFVFIPDGSPGSRDAVIRVRVFPRSEWDLATIKSDWIPSDTLSANCAYRDGSLCWKQSPSYGGSHTRPAIALLMAGLLLFGGSTLISSIRRIGVARAEREQKLFMLQMLTHELRTPAASLKLLLEAFRRDFDRIPKESQAAFLAICDELQRLDRIVEASQDYLISHGTRSLRLEAKHAFPSANLFFSELVESIPDPVEFSPLPLDRPLRLNRYWIELCVRNLVQNARSHGKPPVRLILSETDGYLKITVQDAGSVAFRSLDEMVEPFRKGAKSPGLGLGLSIVRQVIYAQGGLLSFERSPTSFSIKLRAFA